MPNSLALDELVACGLSVVDAEKLAREVNVLPSKRPEDLWPTVSRQLLHASLPPPVYACVHRFVFRDWPAERGPAPAWFPTEEIARNTNIRRLLDELGLDSYADLYTWSIERRSEFWDMMIRRLGVRFRKPYSHVLDQESPQHPKWLVGAKLNIADSCFQADPEAVAIRFSTTDRASAVWTYGRLKELTDRVAGGLQQIGLAAGESVAIDMPMTADSVAIYLGIVQAGCVAVSIADSFAPAEIAARLRIGRAKAIFTQDHIHRGGKQLPLYDRICKANAPRAVVLSGKNSASLSLRDGDIRWNDFLDAAPRAESVARSPDDHTNYLFSSGTTGEPKAIPWNHVTPIKCAVDGFVHQDIQPSDVVAWPTNLGWMMGPWLIYASLINRATIALFDDTPTGRPFGQFVQDACVTVLGVVPSLVATWKTSGCMSGLDWSAIKCFSSTGECSNADDMLWLMAQSGYKPVIEYCGGTELAGGYLAGTLVHPQAPATFSSPTLGTDMVILDESGHLTDNGEVFLVPPAVGMSVELINRDHGEVYFENVPPGPQGQVLRRHGDQVERLAGGYYRAHGRADDTMNLGGIKVSSAEIERVLNVLPGVLETAAVAVPPLEGGPSRLVIFVVPKPDEQVQPVELRPILQQIIRRDLNPLFRIHDVVVVTSLPRTASNKVIRRELRSRYVK